jgi:hypothetical protein
MDVSNIWEIVPRTAKRHLLSTNPIKYLRAITGCILDSRGTWWDLSGTGNFEDDILSLSLETLHYQCPLLSSDTFLVGHVELKTKQQEVEKLASNIKKLVTRKKKLIIYHRGAYIRI